MITTAGGTKTNSSGRVKTSVIAGQHRPGGDAVVQWNAIGRPYQATSAAGTAARTTPHPRVRCRPDRAKYRVLI
ncbi:hypothetical protein [Kitasatospora herbaricolor]|uniref:Uncharacterized protein n=1 Tax=Kitasatospora herbaricolor TaxID=68217 RepID=A0ABZ1WGD4_9ACTN|nr:hypothetical protein [Kitasatospora herbaricolor]